MRKRLAAVAVTGLVAAGCLAQTATAATAGAGGPAPIQLSLPAPTGKYAVGTVSLPLVDYSRPDPWKAGQAYRELMISVFYPTAHPCGHDLAPYMSPGVADAFDAAAAGQFGVPAGSTRWAGVTTHSYTDVPVAHGRFPVILYSPGAGDVRTWDTSAVEDLASRGYVVVTVDHPYEALAVQFPDGHVDPFSIVPEYAKAQQDGTVPAFLQKVMDVRVADTRFVLDRLGTLPHGLPRAMDLDAIGMFGHSAGGFTAASTMAVDPRIKAGADLDGTMEYTDGVPDGTHLSPVAQHGLDRPFLLMGSTGPDGGDHTTEPSWTAFWAHDHGWKADVTLLDSQHASFTDAESLLPQLSSRISATDLGTDIGATDPARTAAATAANRAVVASFFDRWLKGHDDHLLDGVPTTLPIKFVG